MSITEQSSSEVPSRIGLPAGLISQEATVRSAATIAFTEGPAADSEGNVYFSDIINNRIMRARSRWFCQRIPDRQRSNQWKSF